MKSDLRSIARRAALRALAEPDRVPERNWVRVLAGSGNRPYSTQSSIAEQAIRARTRPWVTEECLVGLQPGTRHEVDSNARITPQAQQWAHERGIALVPRGSGGAAHGVHGHDPATVAVGSDHGGFALKAHLIGTLRELGFQVLDQGTRDERSVDYPDYAQSVAECVAQGRTMLGVCIDGAGIGSCMVAAKVPGVLPANCWNVASAQNAREHNHANVLCLGAGHLTRGQADDILRAFLQTSVGPGRHARRMTKTLAIEASYSHSGRASGLTSGQARKDRAGSK